MAERLCELMETFDKSTQCCFTGHRPEKLNISEEEAKALLCSAIQVALDRGYRTFITGMAKGVDIWAGELLLDFKNVYPDIKLICALPYPSFYRGRSKAEQAEYKKILSAANLVHMSYPSYSPLSYQSRNMWMVDNSSLVITLFTGETGGTRNTIRYAESQGLEILNLLN